MRYFTRLVKDMTDQIKESTDDISDTPSKRDLVVQKKRNEAILNTLKAYVQGGPSSRMCMEAFDDINMYLQCKPHASSRFSLIMCPSTRIQRRTCHPGGIWAFAF